MKQECEKYNKLNALTAIYCCPQKTIAYPSKSLIRQTIVQIQKDS